MVAWWRGGVIFRPSVKRLLWRFELSEHAACVTTHGNSTRIAQPGTLQMVEKTMPPRHHATTPPRHHPQHSIGGASFDIYISNLFRSLVACLFEVSQYECILSSL